MYMANQIKLKKTDALMKLLFNSTITEVPEVILHRDSTVEIKYSKRIQFTKLQISLITYAHENGFIELERYNEEDQHHILHACIELVEMGMLTAVEDTFCPTWQLTEVGTQIYEYPTIQL